MTILLFPTYACNLNCMYCFLRSLDLRKERKIPKIDYNRLEKTLRFIKTRLNAEGASIVLHGGEPTCIDLDELEKLVKMIVDNGFKVSAQSNIYNITEDHISLFKEYNVTIGASLDGFPDINTLRGFFDEHGNEIKDKSQEYRERVMKNLERLVRERLCDGVIVVLHKMNAGSERVVERLKEFISWCVSIGVNSIRLNPMFATTGFAKRYELTNDELSKAYIDLYNHAKKFKIHISPFTDFRRILLGNKNVVCWLLGCHYYDSFVWAIDPQGNILSCDRSLASGIWLRPSQLPHTDMFRMQVRTIALLQTELRHDRYAHLHRGGCPAEGIGGDWRRPSRFIPAFDRLFSCIERDIKAELPEVRLTSEYPNKIEFVKLMDSGYKYDIWSGRFVR